MSGKDLRPRSSSSRRAFRTVLLILLILLPIQSLATTTHAATPYELTVEFDVKVTGQIMLAGRVNNLSITIVNRGPDAASVVWVTLSIPPPLALMGKDDTWFFQVIVPGKNVTIEVSVFAPEGSLGSTYSASMKLSYNVGDSGETKTRVISLTVHGFVDPWLSDVTFSPSPAVINQGLTVSGTVTNEGESAATALNISVVSESPFIATEDSSTFIGDVLPTASDTFSITCNVEKVKPGTYPLKLIINYKDDTNTWSSKVVEMNVTVAESAGLATVDMLMIGLVGLGAVVVLAIGIVLYRRRSRKTLEISKKTT